MPIARPLPKARLVFIVSFALLAAFCVLSLIWSGISNAARNPSHLPLVPYSAHGLSTGLNAQASAPLVTPTPCGPGWGLISTTNITPSVALNGITAVSSADVWAVGDSGINRPSLLHWNGLEWSTVPSPIIGEDNHLYGIDAISSNDVWVVGDYSGGTRIEHWNGSAWSVVPSPGEGQLKGVAAVSSNDVWAVGWYNDGRTLIERWNGATWSVVASPNVGTDGSYLKGVTAVTSNNVWAVGYYLDDSRVYRTLIEHWNGTSWSVVASLNVGTDGSALNGVTAISSTDIWAVGGSGGGTRQALIEHWNGTSWSVVASPSVVEWNYLNSIAAVSSSDVWAVGTRYFLLRPPDDFSRTLVEHWDGSTWSVVPSANLGQHNYLWGVAMASSTDGWAVGFADTTSNPTLIERYYPSLCAPTPTPTATSTPQPPSCPGERFTDVCPNDYFYTATLALADDGILSGYSTVPPCPNSQWIPCFRPYNSSTRGQISKVVTLAAHFNEPVTGQTFEDVPPGSTFYTYTERMAERGIISGYPCGGSGEPCVPPGNRPYFRTNNNVTRGQLSKMVSLAFGWNDPPAGQDFEDVPPASTFYTYTFQLYSRSIINGYQCGGSGEPCVPPDNHPYFRPNNNVIRGQTAKIVQLARTQPACSSQWHIISSPNPPNTSSYLNGIAVVADNDIWAVGYSSSPTATLTLAEHWDGTSWSIVPSPNPSASHNILNAVAAVATNDVWAVGEYEEVYVPSRILIEHWDGTSWSVVPVADPVRSSSELCGVTALATDNVWAVGIGAPSIGDELIEHWDGSTWSIVPSPDTTWSGPLVGIAAVNSNDIWAVGYTQYCFLHMCHFFTLVEHWDGSTWNVVASPNPNPQWSLLFGVAVVSANDVWAVGNAGGTLVEHWDGSTWSVVPSPNPGTNDGLGGVAVIGANDVWAVGGSNGGTLVEHWNGSLWNVVSSPNMGTGANTLSGVAVVGANDVWAVGNSCCPNRTLVERYNPCIPATSTPTATPTTTLVPTIESTATTTATVTGTPGP